MGERVLCKHEVVGSIPSASTSSGGLSCWCGPREAAQTTFRANGHCGDSRAPSRKPPDRRPAPSERGGRGRRGSWTCEEERETRGPWGRRLRNRPAPAAPLGREMHRRGVRRVRRGSPLRAGRRLAQAKRLGDQVKKGHLVDALALRGDEGRGTLRKATGSREQALIRGYPNGETPSARRIRP